MTKKVIEDGIVAGNVTDKYGTTNLAYRKLTDRFLETAADLVNQTGATDLHEAGCGEGHLARTLAKPGRNIRASDFSKQIIDQAEAYSGSEPEEGIEFLVRSIYDLKEEDSAQLMVCCEVMEHLEEPEAALEVLASLARPYVLVSVPREPIWRILNVWRGKYLGRLGNTPGHLNHWSSGSFIRFLERHLEVIDVRKPFPWTMVLCKSRTGTS